MDSRCEYCCDGLGWEDWLVTGVMYPKDGRETYHFCSLRCVALWVTQHDDDAADAVFEHRFK